MAGLVNTAGLLALLSLVPFGTALAASDPTRPPASWLSPSEAPAGVAGKSLRLQSVLMPQRGRPVAIIGGQTVALGERVGDARLIRLTEREAVLQGPDGVTRLYLTPDVDKRMIVAPAATKARQAAQGKEKR
jgi:MSHA biogenesis protein MshK